MKLIKSQILQNAAPSIIATTLSTENFPMDTNISSSSSSSFTSSNFGNVTPTPKTQQQFQNPQNFNFNQTSNTLNRLLSNHLQSSKMLMNNSKFNPQTQMQLQMLSQQQTQPLSITSQAQSFIHYFCNKCGKNLLEKKTQQNPTLTQHNSTNNVPLNQQISINTKNFPININNASKSDIEVNINGCYFCGNFLPQCVVCLRLMKINLQPSQVAGSSQNPSHNHHHGPLNRPQSYMHQSNPKLLLTNYQSAKNKQIVFQCNTNSPTALFNENITQATSSNTTLSTHQNVPDAKNQNSKQLKDITNANINSSSLENVKHTFNGENIYFLNNYKCGNWFSWCQSCKHGGHIKHLMEWFKYNKKCPYVHCECSCANLDHET